MRGTSPGRDPGDWPTNEPANSTQPTNDWLVGQFQELGASVIHAPACEIMPGDLERLSSICQTNTRFGSLVFLSPNAVHSFAEAVTPPKREAILQSKKLFAIGVGTGNAVLKNFKTACHVPRRSDSDGLAKLLIENRQYAPFLILRGNRGSSVLPDQLEQHEISFEQWVAYQSKDIEVAPTYVVDLMCNGQIDWVTLTSSAIASSVCRLYSDDLQRVKLASISPQTSQRLRKHSFEPTVEATDYNLQGIVDAICQFELASD